jgi:SAM-dependent methyltransferase
MGTGMGSTLPLDRVERERRFHDDRFSADDGEARDRFYEEVGGARAALRRATDRFRPGDRVLELGVGVSSTGWDLARRGVDVIAVDISPVAVERGRAQAAAEGLTSIEFRVMNAEDLELDTASVDGVVGSGILHHLDLDRAYREVRRVLRTDGHAVFYEPLGHNPLINAYRDRTPDMRTADEHPLRREDLRAAERHFGSVGASMHHCTVIGCALLPAGLARPVRPLLRAVDRLLLALPGVRWWGWITVMELGRPR